MLYLLALVFIGSVLLWYVVLRCFHRRFYELASLIPGTPGALPIIGSTHKYTGSNESTYRNIMESFDYSRKNYGGDMFKQWLGPMLYIIMKPEDVEIVLNKSMEKDMMYDFLKPWIGDGLVTGRISIWRRHRKLLTPAFNQKLLTGFISMFVEHGQVLVRKMEKEIGRDQFDPFSYMSPCTLDIICESAMGVRVNAQDDMNLPFIRCCIRQMNVIINRMLTIYLHPDWIFYNLPSGRLQREDLKIMHDYSNNIVLKKRLDFLNKSGKYLQDTGGCESKQRKAFLDLMIEYSETGNRWSDKELREEVDTMIIAGSDTTSRLSCFVLLCLGCYPKIQDKVVDELRDIFGDTLKQIEMEDLLKMEYLGRVIKETLRLFPIVPFISRKICEELQIGKHTLPKGCGCVVGVAAIHRDPRWWGDAPDDFNPDHFLPERCAKRRPYTYIPFSAGPRNCIGQRFAVLAVLTIVSTVLRSYVIHSDIDFKNIEFKVEVLLKTSVNKLISIERRMKL